MSKNLRRRLSVGYRFAGFRPIYPPAGFIVGGCLLILGALMLALGHRTTG
jgi:hypothetical protein